MWRSHRRAGSNESPVSEMLSAFDRVLTAKGREALQYSTTEGFAPLREWIAARVSTPEAPVSPDEVLMVSGSQQGLDLLAKVLIDPGDTVRVHVRIKEGDKERLQAFEGVVIARKHGGIRETITVRKTSFGIGVERIFPLHSPVIQKIDIVRSAKVRRAKLYYLRELKGKAARMKEVRKTPA